MYKSLTEDLTLPLRQGELHRKSDYSTKFINPLGLL